MSSLVSRRFQRIAIWTILFVFAASAGAQSTPRRGGKTSLLDMADKAKKQGKRSLNDLYAQFEGKGAMYCCDKRLLVFPPGATWELANRDIDCGKYIREHPEAARSICKQLSGKAVNCLADAGAVCCKLAMCSGLGRVASAIAAAIPTTKTGRWEKETALDAVQPPFKSRLENALDQVRNCANGEDQSALDAAVAMARKLDTPSRVKTTAKQPNPYPKTPTKTAVENTETLRKILDLLQGLAQKNCGARPMAGGRCPIPPLTLKNCQHEKDKSHDRGSLSGPTKTALECIEKLAASSGKPFKMKFDSGYRSEAYQAHFWQLYNNYVALLRTRNPACDAIREEYARHMASHGIYSSVSNPCIEGVTPPCLNPDGTKRSSFAKHPEGEALDLGDFADEWGACCNLYKPYPRVVDEKGNVQKKGDPIHWELCPPEMNCEEKCPTAETESGGTP